MTSHTVTAGLGTPESASPFMSQYRHPMEVTYHSQLSAAEKRSILSSWLSDACAIESSPLLRRDPMTGFVSRYDEIADALRALDEEEARYLRAARHDAKARNSICLGTAVSRKRAIAADRPIVPPARTGDLAMKRLVHS